MKNFCKIIFLNFLFLSLLSCGTETQVGDEDPTTPPVAPTPDPTAKGLDEAIFISTARSVTNGNSGHTHNDIYYSFDLGRTWKELKRPDDEFRHGPPRMLTYKSNELLFSSYGAISKLKSFESSWEFTKLGANSSVYDYYESGGLIVAATSRRLQTSSDSGTTWRSYSQADLGGGHTNTAVQIEEHSGRLYAATNYDIIYSENDGNTWSVVPYAGSNVNKRDYNPRFVFTETSIFISGGTLGLFRSDHSANLWTKIELPYPADYQWTKWARNIIYDGKHLFTIGAFGLYKSSDEGVSWSLITKESISGRNSEPGSIYNISAYGDTLMLMLSKPSRVFISENSGISFRLVNFDFKKGERVQKLLVPNPNL